KFGISSLYGQFLPQLSPRYDHSQTNQPRLKHRLRLMDKLDHPPPRKAPGSARADPNLRVEGIRDAQVTALRPLRPRPVTRLKTFVPWAKSIKLSTLTGEPPSLGH